MDASNLFVPMQEAKVNEPIEEVILEGTVDMDSDIVPEVSDKEDESVAQDDDIPGLAKLVADPVIVDDDIVPDDSSEAVKPIAPDVDDNSIPKGKVYYRFKSSETLQKTLTPEELDMLGVMLQLSSTDITVTVGTPPEVVNRINEFKELILKCVLSEHIRLTERVVSEFLKYFANPFLKQNKLDFYHDNNRADSKVKVPPAFRCHSPLMIACEKVNTFIVKMLLDNGASVAFKNKDRLNALHIACNTGNIQIVHMLLTAASEQSNYCRNKKLDSDLQVALNTRNKRGWTPLMFAACKGHTEVVELLVNTEHVDFQIRNGKQKNVVHIAAESDLECVKVIIAALADDVKESICLATDKKGWNILHHVCAKGSVEMLRWLMENVHRIKDDEVLNHQNKAGYTPLLTACEYQKEDIVEYLLEQPEINVSLCVNHSGKDYDGPESERPVMSGLHITAIHGTPNIARLLIEKKCPLNCKDKEGNTALHTAYTKSSFEVVNILRQANGGELESVQNKDGKLPAEIEPEDVIPPEIVKRGPGAVELYKKTLKQGKEKIPRCSLLFLGDKRVGKTSVYRLLVGLGFNLDQDPTMGIDNTIVSTVDKRDVSIGRWKEESQDLQRQQSDDLFVQSVVDAVPLSIKKDDPKHFTPIPEDELMREIDQLLASSASQTSEVRQEPLASPGQPDIQSPMLSVQPFPLHTDSKKSQQPAPNLSKGSDQPKPASGVKQSSEARMQPQKSVASSKPLKPLALSSPSANVTQIDLKGEEPIASLTPPASPPPPRVSRRYSRSINKGLKATHLTKNEPALILNVLDFAGHKEYRPMHHCFIIRRAMYALVFNLQEMVKCLDSSQPCKPLEEIRYWLHSIHAHIYPPDVNERGEDEKMRRVCLVGTHRAPPDKPQITEDQLEKINKKLKELCSDERCIAHLCYMGPDKKRVFIAVENSIDGKEDEDRVNSGAKALQEELKKVSSRLSFLKEVYPILWLRFESDLVSLRESHKQKTPSIVADMKELQLLASRHQISTPEEQDLAFRFFHDTGKIVCLQYIPTMFLNKQEQDMLSNLVIFDQSWLISVMKKIIEVNASDEGITPKHIIHLEKTGIAHSLLLKECWSEFLDPSREDSFLELCLILKAHCLIYPVHFYTIEKDTSGPRLEKSTAILSDTTPSSQNLPLSQDAIISDKEAESFLIPSRLPDMTDEDREHHKDCLPWVSFFFDFWKFLPAEIFHRLICLFLAHSEAKGRMQKESEYFFNTCCFFVNVRGRQWKIELEKEYHRLKVSTVLLQECDKPSEYFKYINEEFLLPICKGSNLQGLEYHGGLLVKCDGPKCQKNEVLIEFVSYIEGDCQLSPSSNCSNCNQKYDLDLLIKSQPEDHLFEKSSLRKITVDNSKHTPCQDTESNETACKPDTVSNQSNEYPPLNIRNLAMIKWKDSKGATQRFYLLSEIAPKWRKAGIFLGMEESDLEIELIKHRNDPEECCCAIFTRWFQDASSLSNEYPLSWDGVCELLKDLKYSEIAKSLKRALKNAS